MTSIWIIIALTFLFAELGSPGLFFFVSFALGALVSAVFSMFSFCLSIQVMTFVSASILTFFVIRKFLQRAKFSDIQYERSETNIDALVGKTAVVVKDIKNLACGRVKIGGELWVARSDENEVIEVGEVVCVVAVSGNKVLVKKIF